MFATRHPDRLQPENPQGRVWKDIAKVRQRAKKEKSTNEGNDVNTQIHEDQI